MSTELAIREDQEAFDDKQIAALRQLGVAGASRADQAIFFHQCVRTGLDPFARQIYLIERQGKQTIQTGIDGFRLVARRAADRNGETIGYAKPLWCDIDGEWRDVWVGPGNPVAAQFTVYRDGQPFTATALMSEFMQTKRDGAPMAQWAVKPAHMLSKCAEALALRMAFPQDLSGIYTTDEMGADDRRPRQHPRHGRIRSIEQVGLPPGEEDDGSADDAQRRKMFALYRRLGLDDRDARLADTSERLGRLVASSTDLDGDELAALNAALEQATDGMP